METNASTITSGYVPAMSNVALGSRRLSKSHICANDTGSMRASIAIQTHFDDTARLSIPLINPIAPSQEHCAAKKKSPARIPRYRLSRERWVSAFLIKKKKKKSRALFSVHASLNATYLRVRPLDNAPDIYVRIHIYIYPGHWSSR